MLPSYRWTLVIATAVLGLLPPVASAQPGPGFDPGAVSPVLSGAGGFVGTFVVGAIVLAVAPQFVDRVVDRIQNETANCFGWGILALIIFFGVVVLLAITIIGILLVIPLAIAFVVLAAVGNALGYLALFANAVDDHWIALLIGAAISGLTSVIPIVGSLVGFVVGSLGVGAVLREWRR